MLTDTLINLEFNLELSGETPITLETAAALPTIIEPSERTDMLKSSSVGEVEDENRDDSEPNFLGLLLLAAECDKIGRAECSGSQL